MSSCILARLDRTRRRIAACEHGFTLVELLLVVVISGIIAAALGSAFVAGGRTTTDAQQRLKESTDAQLATAYFVADGANASYFSATAASASSQCPDPGAGNDVAMFEWSDPAAKAVYYYKTGSALATLHRRYCTGSTVVSDTALVNNMATSVLTCPGNPQSICSTTPASVNLQITETSGYSYQMRTSPRPGSSTPGGKLPGVAAYVGGGGITLGGNSTLNVLSGIVQIEQGQLNCNGSGSRVSAPDGFYLATNGSIRGTCTPTPTTVNPVGDPLSNLPTPVAPGTAQAATSNTTTPCSATPQTMYHKGTYGNNVTLSNGCLESGTYWFPNGVTLDNVTSAPGGVLIYVDSGGVTFNNTVTLSPVTDTTNQWAGVTMFLGRSNHGTLLVKNPITVNGVTYAPAGVLSLSSNGAAYQDTAIDVYELDIQGNATVTINRV